jgi:CubicO group peptidase (beta-lactamase class C family)
MTFRKVLLFLSVLVSAAGTGKSQTLNVQTRPQVFATARNPESLGFSAERFARIDALMQDHVRKKHMPGATMILVRKGQIVYYKSFGYRDVEAGEVLDKTAIFRIMSMSKAITSVAVMLLYEEGKLRLDDPVSRYIPSFRNPKVLAYFNAKDTTWSGIPAKREVTIRHLLTHTAGINYSHPLYKKAGIPDFFSIEPKQITQTMSAMGTLPLLHEPGEKHTYGLNTDVLGAVVEIVSGMRFGEFLQKRIFEPLGMEDTGFYQPDSKKNRLMHLYSKRNLDAPLERHPDFAEENYPIAGAKTYESGGAGLTSTVLDYAKFLQMLINGGSFNGKQLLSRKTIDLMCVNQIGDLEIGAGNKFGLGFEIETARGNAQAPGSVGTLRWGGRNCSDYWFDPKEQILGVWTTQLLPNAIPGIEREFKQLAYQALVD